MFLGVKVGSIHQLHAIVKGLPKRFAAALIWMMKKRAPEGNQLYLGTRPCASQGSQDTAP